MTDAPVGWRCPCCGVIYAPAVLRCSDCEPEPDAEPNREIREIREA